jgi:hypothetical protein
MRSFLNPKFSVVITLLTLFTMSFSVLSAPTLTPYGDIRFGLISEETQDLNSELYYGAFGVRGEHNIEQAPIQIFYKLGADYSSTDRQADAEDNDEFDLRESNLLIKSPYGAVFLGNGTAGVWTDLYSRVDRFQFNSQERSWKNTLGGNHHSFYAQSKYAQNVLAYISPNWNDWQVKAAYLSTAPDNGEDNDITSLRAVYDSGRFAFAVSGLKISEKLSATTNKDYYRYASVISYQWQGFYIAALIEDNQDVFGRQAALNYDHQVYGVTVEYRVNNWILGLGHQYKNWDGSPTGYDSEALSQAIAHYHFDPHFSVFAEIAMYNENYTDKGNNGGVGVQFTF